MRLRLLLKLAMLYSMTTSKVKTEQASSNKTRHTVWWVLASVAFAIILLIGAGMFAVSQLVGPGVDQRAAALSTLPIDQPSPIPSSKQLDMVEDYCQIITPAIAQRMKAIAAPINTESFIGGCDIPLEGGAFVQVSSPGTYGQLEQIDAPWFVTSATVAGLEARLFNLGAPLSGECTLQLNTRSVTTVTVNVRWIIANDLERATKRTKSCEIARESAEVLAAAYVPLAGGTAHPKTLQKPSASIIEPYPCKVVSSSAALRASIYDEADDKNGKQAQRQAQKEQCTYALGADKAVVTLYMNKTLGDLPAANAAMTNRQLGTLSARQTESGGSCSFAVELAEGIISEIVFTSDKTDGSACVRAEQMQASSVDALISASSSSAVR